MGRSDPPPAAPTAPAPPQLSVVVPLYRVEAYLAECLRSILDDAGAEVEVVVVDDGSPDRSGEIAAGFARADPRVRTLRLATNLGLGAARNAGLDRATGGYVWFVDGDDRLPPGAVRAVLARVGGTRPDVLVVDHAEVRDDGRVGPPRAGGGVLAGAAGPFRLADRPQLLRLAQSACTKVVRRAFLAEIGLRFVPGWYEDSAFSHPLLLAAGRIDTLDQVCYHYRQRAGGITKTVSHRHFDVFDQYRRLFEFLDRAAPRYEQFRPALFRLMVDHYLVIVGNPRRVPPRLRRAFFRRMAGDLRSRLPAGGYPVPAGTPGLKHRLVRRNAYLAYAALRIGHRLGSRLVTARGGTAGPRRATPVVVSGPASDPSSGRTT